MILLKDISFLWSMLHVVVLFLLLFEPRYSWKTTLIAGFAGCGGMLAVSILAWWFLDNASIMSITLVTCTIPSMLMFVLLSKYRDGRFFFLFCLTDTMSVWILQISNFLDRLAGDTYIVMFITRILLFLVLELLFWHWRQPYLELQRKLATGWWPFAAIGGTYYLLVLSIAVPVGTPLPDAEGLMRILLVLILMPLTYLTVLRSLWIQMREAKTHAELELSAVRSQLAYENIRILQESAQALSQARHDMLGNMGILQTLSRQGDYEKLDEYLTRITQQTTEIIPLRISSHPIVNAILTQVAERAKTEGIELRCQVDLPETLGIPDEDLAAFLMNLLSNALDAAKEIMQGRPKWVEITLHIRGKYLFIEGQNTFAWAPEPGEDGERYLTHKGAGHGYGLRIMEGIARRYNSELQTEVENGIFLARTALLIPQNK